MADPVFADISAGGVGVAEFRSAADAERSVSSCLFYFIIDGILIQSLSLLAFIRVVDKLDDTKFDGAYIRITLDSAAAPVGRDRSAAGGSSHRDRSRSRSRDRRRERSRSRSV